MYKRQILEHQFDIVVAEGFAGNVLLKTIEGVAKSLGKMIKGIFLQNLKTKIGALLVKKGINAFRKKFDYSEYGPVSYTHLWLVNYQKNCIHIEVMSLLH